MHLCDVVSSLHNVILPMMPQFTQRYPPYDAFAEA
jgi:hypothetical protein